MTKEWFEQVCYSALGHRTSQEQTYDLARVTLARGIPGEFVECGVYAGASCAIMARAILDHNFDVQAREQRGKSNAKVHLFDSFAGIPAPGPHDDPSQVREGEAKCTIIQVQANMQRWGIPSDMLAYHAGLFADTVPLFEKRPIAFLRLDGDLYESTKVCMEHLYPLVSKGGYVICDDYDLHGCRYALHETVMPAPIAWRKWT
jgi:O-methyltransferase